MGMPRCSRAIARTGRLAPRDERERTDFANERLRRFQRCELAAAAQNATADALGSLLAQAPHVFVRRTAVHVAACVQNGNFNRLGLTIAFGVGLHRSVPIEAGFEGFRALVGTGKEGAMVLADGLLATRQRIDEEVEVLPLVPGDQQLRQTRDAVKREVPDAWIGK